MSRLKSPHQVFRSVHLGLTRFLTMVEVAEVEDGVVIIDRVAIFYDEGEGGEHYRNKNKFRCRVSRIENRLVKLKEKICLLPARRLPGGGGTWVFFGWVCAAWDSKLARRSVEMGQFFILLSRKFVN